jgi:hypothetical protein
VLTSFGSKSVVVTAGTRSIGEGAPACEEASHVARRTLVVYGWQTLADSLPAV